MVESLPSELAAGARAGAAAGDAAGGAAGRSGALAEGAGANGIRVFRPGDDE